MIELLRLYSALSPARWRAILAALLSACCCCTLAWAQSSGASESVRNYPLKYKLAADVSRMARQRIGGEAEIVIDARANSVQMRGSESSHRILQKLIASVDVAGVPQSYTSPANQQPMPDREWFVPLTAIRPEQSEAMLRHLFGVRLARSGQSASTTASWTVTDRAGARATVSADVQRSGLIISGAESTATQVARLIHADDASRKPMAGALRTVSLRKADPRKVQEALDAYRRGRAGSAGGSGKPGLPQADGRQGAQLAQAPPADAAPAPAADAQTPPLSAEDVEKAQERLRELGLDLNIETLPDLDAIILRGNNRDVNEVLRIIEDIERLSAETVPTIEVMELKHVGSEALAPMLTAIQKDLMAGRPGRVTITALNKPNALLLIGWGEAINSIKELIAKLDQAVEPNTQLRVFRLQHAPAAIASTTIQEFFGKRTGLGPKVIVAADVRSNSLIVQAPPRDMAEVELLVKRLDTGGSASINQVRIFKLKNSLAQTLATTLQAAMDSQRSGQGGAAAAGGKSSILELLTVDPQGEKILKSGILADVKITADARANTLIVSAPAPSMELIAALIAQLDDAPVAVSQIKVFHIVNGDAAALVLMLRALLPSQSPTAPGTTLARADGETSFAPLRYSVEPRTNSIIAAGSAGDLAIIEALLLRLDERDVQERKNAVYQLRNSPALDVADAINLFLRSERQLQQAAPGTISPFQQIESEVVVVPEPVGNSLIISATPRYFDEIYKMVEKIDAQPPQVLIQVLIAEVTLSDATQFGIEWGLQDGLLFDRSLLGSLLTTNTTTTFGNPPTTVQTQTIRSATNTPGFEFNSGVVGNSGSDGSLATAAQVGKQALSNFAVGRTAADLGFGGLVLSAGSKSVNVLLRALQQNQRLEVLSRPQVMTIDNQPAFIQVGQKVPRITNFTINQIGQNTSIALENVGLILGVTPRISPEGMVVMEVNAEKSDVAPESEGIPVSVSATGAVVRSPRYNITSAQTTVSTASGETIVLGGLITRSEQTIDRRVPYLSNVPVLGWMFRYDQYLAKRTELLIILTPHVVRNARDSERLKQVEAARMHWCAAEVHAIHGNPEFCRRGDCPTCNAELPIVYPDLDPQGMAPTLAPPDPDSENPEGPDELPGVGVSARKLKPQPRPIEARPGQPAGEPRTAAQPAVQPSVYYGAPQGASSAPARMPAAPHPTPSQSAPPQPVISAAQVSYQGR
jgi:type II secretion system protein D